MENDVATMPANDGVELGVLEDLVGYHLRRASSVFAADFARALAGTEMRQVLFGVLSVVAANPGINQGAAGRVLGIQRANMVSLINQLVDQGLVERCAVDGDRRAFALRLTDTGEATLTKSLARIREHEGELLADLHPEERATLVRLLGRIEARER
jgi:DNA-binding MarR family transcriptional regulator